MPEDYLPAFFAFEHYIEAGRPGMQLGWFLDA